MRSPSNPQEKCNILFGLLICYAVAGLVFTICAAVAAGRGAPYAYRLSLKLVR